MTYDILADEMQDEKMVRVAPNTYAHRIGPDLITITLHGHTILTFSSAGTIGATDAGWPTLTTVKRLNAFTPDRFLFTRASGTVYVIDMSEEADIRKFSLSVVECLDPSAPNGQGIVLNIRDLA